MYSPIVIHIESESEFIDNGAHGIDVANTKLCWRLCTDDSDMFSNAADDLQSGFDMFYDYCKRWIFIDVNSELVRNIFNQTNDKIENVDEVTDQYIDALKALTYTQIDHEALSCRNNLILYSLFDNGHAYCLGLIS